MSTISDHSADNLQRTPATSQSSNNNQPQYTTPGELMNIITEMQDHIEQLEAQLQAPLRVTSAITIPAVKVHKAECFDGTWSKLWAFLTQMDMHIDVNNNVLRT